MTSDDNNNVMIFPKINCSGGVATTLRGGTVILSGGTPDTGCGTLFWCITAKFNR